MSAAGITLLHSGGAEAIVTIRHYHLVALVSTGLNMQLNLTQYPTLADLVAQINSYSGYVATLDIGADPNASPLALIDIERVDIATTPLRLFVSTSLLWAILKPMAWAVEDSYVNIFGGFSETDPSTADGSWVDVWGSMLGNVTRNTGEDDANYSTRLVKEVFRQRLTPMALELIVLQDTGIVVVVTGNLYSEVFIVGVSLVGGKILSDRLHSRTVFYVQIPALTDPAVITQIKNIVNRNRMAGTMPVFQLV